MTTRSRARFACSMPLRADRRRAVHVGGDEARRAVLPAQLARELGGGGGLPRPLQSHHHHDSGRHSAQLEPLAALAEHRRQLDLAQPFLDVALGEHAPTAQAGEGRL
jgi:hypothetical protein